MSNLCITCRSPKAPYTCGLCQEHSCKSHTHFLGEESFSYMRKVPAELKHNTYCSICFDAKIGPQLDQYNDTLEKAREVYIFTKEQSKQTRLLNRKEDPYFVENCEDEQDAIMRMSFYAVEAKHNALIDIVLKSKKIVVGSHKKSIWSGTAIPVTIDPNKVYEEGWK